MVESLKLCQGNVFVLFKGAGAQSQTWRVLDKQCRVSCLLFALSYALLSLNVNYEELKMLIDTRKS